MTLLSSGNIVLKLSTFFYIISAIQEPLSNLPRKHVNGHLPFLCVLVVKKEGSLTLQYIGKLHTQENTFATILTNPCVWNEEWFKV